ncbi:MAG: chain length determinant protein tyrosine kinase EpsG [Betaproteobacteria bacterium]|nr:chain length determinant protein tyrosine kinase EpsG [Betaproteobacteria bacterium]
MNKAVFDLREPTLRTPAGGVDERPIGRILVDLGKLRERDVERAFALHRKKGLRFGEAACSLGLISPADVHQALSIQFNYPYVQRGQGTLSAELIAAHDPYHPQSEALREVRTHLLTHWLTPQRKVLAVVSAAPGDGRSYLAANLAVSFAQLGEKTLLVDADLRSPRQHRIFGLGGGPGLARALAAGLGLGIAERIAYFDHLSVLTAGAAPPNPLELLSRGDLQRLLGEARLQYAMVIVDTAAGSRGADARLTAARADGALMLACKDRTRLADFDRLRGAVAAYGVPLVGAVLNGA